MSERQRIIPPGETLPAMNPPGRSVRPGGETVGKNPPKRNTGNRGGAIRRRFALLNAFADRALPLLSQSGLAAWLVLFRHAKPDGTVSASVADLARRVGCCERAMRYGLRRLQDAGLVERLKRGTLAGGPSIWRLLMPPEGDANRHRNAG